MKELSVYLGVNEATVVFFSILIIILGLIGIFRLTCVAFIDSHEIGYMFDRRTGEITILNRTGYFIIIPIFTSVNKIDCRIMPVKTEITKIVRFKRDKCGVLQFIQMHGRKSYNMNDLSEILKKYVYENYDSGEYSEDTLHEKYKFLDIIKNTVYINPTILENSKVNLN